MEILAACVLALVVYLGLMALYYTFVGCPERLPQV